MFMIRMTVVAKVIPEKLDEFLDAMHYLQNDRLAEKGIRGSQMYEDGEDHIGFRLVDEWETDEDLQRYFSTEGFRILLGALRTLCMEAEVKFDPLCGGGGDLKLNGFDSARERRG